MVRALFPSRRRAVGSDPKAFIDLFILPTVLGFVQGTGLWWSIALRLLSQDTHGGTGI